jgi:hypothetical protein
MQRGLNTQVLAVFLAVAMLVVLGVASIGSAAHVGHFSSSHGRELKELVVALDLELHTLNPSTSAASPQRLARVAKEAKNEYAQPRETVTSCMRYGTATSMGVWAAALAADPDWAAANGDRNVGLSKEQGCPDPSRLELWGSICYGRCPAGFSKTSLCTCTSTLSRDANFVTTLVMYER